MGIKGEVRYMFKDLSHAIRSALWCVPLAICCVGAHAVAGRSQMAAELYDFSLDNKPAFQGLIEFAVQNRIPVGIVLARNPDLCKSRKKLTLRNATAQKIMEALL